MTADAMPESRLADIRERELLATEGPWIRWTDQDKIPGWDGFYVVGDDVAEGEDCNPTARVYTDTDADFIAQARQDIPDLLTEVERLRTPPPPGELLGLETLCAALHAASETDPLVKDVAWRTFALIRAHREQSAEVERLKARIKAALDLTLSADPARGPLSARAFIADLRKILRPAGEA